MIPSPKPSRVMHVVWEYPPVIYGGLARHAEHLARAQHDAGHDVTVITAAEDVTDPTRRVPAASAVRRGVTVHRARRASPRTPWTDILRAAAELETALTATGLEAADTNPPDVVHGHDWTAFGAARTIADKIGVPLVLTVHATEHGRHAGNLSGPAGPGADDVRTTIDRLERTGVTSADAVIVCSAAMRDEVTGVLGAHPDRVTTIRNAVAAASWHCGPGAVRASRRHWTDTPGGARTTSAPPRSEVLIAAAGRIEWEKGFSTLIRAIPGVRESAGLSVRVVLAGRGSELPRLRRLAAELGVTDCLTLPGWLSRRDLAALYAAADAVVVPSRYEPSGLVAREAQAAGASVIVTDVGGLSEAVTHGVTGLTIGVGDVYGLRDSILRLVADPAGARLLGQAAAREVERWTWPDAAAMTEEVYRSVVDGARLTDGADLADGVHLADGPPAPDLAPRAADAPELLPERHPDPVIA